MSWEVNAFIIGTAFFVFCSIVAVILILVFVIHKTPDDKKPTPPPPVNPDSPLNICKVTNTVVFSPVDTILTFGTNPTSSADPPFKYEGSGVFSYAGNNTQVTLWIKLKSEQSDWVVSAQVYDGTKWFNLSGISYSDNGITYNTGITLAKDSKIRLYLVKGVSISFDIGGIFELSIPKES